jgi:hypothetical protein
LGVVIGNLLLVTVKRFFGIAVFMENIIIGSIFLSAIAYLGNIVYQNFNPKNKAGCSKGCGSCGAVDFDKIATQMESHK